MSIIKRYSAPGVEIPAPKVISSAPAAPAAEAKEPAVSFERPNAAVESLLETATVPTEAGAPAAATPAAGERAERRAAFKHAADVERRAMQMKKQAESELSQARQFQALMDEAKKDPTAIAKAMGMDPTEFLTRYQNRMFQINDAPALKPEDEVKQRLERYEAERQQEREHFQKVQSQTVRQTYIAGKILPVIASDPEKFQLLNLQGRETCAAFIYDMMDAHFRETGEEWDAAEVAEEMEAELTKEIESQMGNVRKLSKFSKHFSPGEPASGGAPAQLGAKPDLAAIRTANRSKAGRTLSDSLGSSAPEAMATGRSAKADRLNRLLDRFNK